MKFSPIELDLTGILAGMPLGNQTWLGWAIPELAMEVYSWGNRSTKWRIFWVAMFDYRYEQSYGLGNRSQMALFQVC